MDCLFVQINRMIAVKKLVKRFGLKTVLRGLNFEAQEGEFVALHTARLIY